MNRPDGTFFTPTSQFFDEITQYIGDKKALEVFAGNGLLASEIQKRGGKIHPTSILSGMDRHEYKMYTNVEHMDCVDAVVKYNDEYDILIFCWATTTIRAFQALLMWGDSKPVIFIGEAPLTDPSVDFPGCATDEFHYAFRREGAFNHYHSRNMLDSAHYGYLDVSRLDKSIKSIEQQLAIFNNILG